jgi:hyperosmotically inducible protein
MLNRTLFIAAAVIALAACTDRTSNETTGQKIDSAIDKTEKATAAAADKAADLAETARDKTVAFAKSPEVKREAEDAKNALKNAGAAAVSAVDDATITASISASLAKDAELSATRIDVTTKGGVVSLTGPAPNAAAKTRAEEIAKAVKGVSSVDNRLEVKAM